MAEAMALGKPVIATRYSREPRFMTSGTATSSPIISGCSRRRWCGGGIIPPPAGPSRTSTRRSVDARSLGAPGRGARPRVEGARGDPRAVSAPAYEIVRPRPAHRRARARSGAGARIGARCAAADTRSVSRASSGGRRGSRAGRRIAAHGPCETTPAARAFGRTSRSRGRFDERFSTHSSRSIAPWRISNAGSQPSRARLLRVNPERRPRRTAAQLSRLSRAGALRIHVRGARRIARSGLVIRHETVASINRRVSRVSWRAVSSRSTSAGSWCASASSAQATARRSSGSSECAANTRQTKSGLSSARPGIVSTA